MLCTRDIRTDEGKTIALVGYRDYANDVFEDVANARLIASAPELLQALERADLSTAQIRLAADVGKTTMKGKIHWYESQLERLGGEIRAAIAKAKGCQ